MKESIEKKFLIYTLFLGICSPTIASFSPLGGDMLEQVFGIMDEICALIIVIYTFIFKGFHRRRDVITIIILLYIVGLISGVNSEFSFMTNSLGAFNNLKSILLFPCFCQYNFSRTDFYRLCKCFIFFLPIIAISYILEALTPMRSFLFAGGEDVDMGREGLFSMGGLFKKLPIASLWGLIYYIIFFYYKEENNKNRLCYLLGTFMILITIKVKEIFAFFVVFLIGRVRKIKPVSVVLMSLLFMILFEIYSVLLPQHYERYFGEGFDSSARYVMTITSLEIASDYFPLGVGWGKFGSSTSMHVESEIYSEYHIDHIYGLNYDGYNRFMQDNQLPMFLGETGVLGTILFFILLIVCFKPFLMRFFKNSKDKNVIFPSLLFIFFFICIWGKPVFVAVPHSFVIWGISGMFYSLSNRNVF